MRTRSREARNERGLILVPSAPSFGHRHSLPHLPLPLCPSPQGCPLKFTILRGPQGGPLKFTFVRGAQGGPLKFTFVRRHQGGPLTFTFVRGPRGCPLKFTFVRGPQFRVPQGVPCEGNGFGIWRTTYSPIRLGASIAGLNRGPQSRASVSGVTDSRSGGPLTRPFVRGPNRGFQSEPQFLGLRIRDLAKHSLAHSFGGAQSGASIEGLNVSGYGLGIWRITHSFFRRIIEDPST